MRKLIAVCVVMALGAMQCQPSFGEPPGDAVTLIVKPIVQNDMLVQPAVAVNYQLTSIECLVMACYETGNACLDVQTISPVLNAEAINQPIESASARKRSWQGNFYNRIHKNPPCSDNAEGHLQPSQFF